MDLSVIAFLGLLLAVAFLRLAELRISKRHQREMVARGAAKVDEPKFRWMVLLHTAVLIGAALEVFSCGAPLSSGWLRRCLPSSSQRMPCVGGSFARSGNIGTFRSWIPRASAW
jgi:methyltransferase